MANVHQPFLWNCKTARRFSGITNQIRDAGAGACVHFANPSGQGERPGFMTESCHSYTVYGLRVASDKPVLEFEPPDFFAFPDIRILWSASGEPAPDFGDRDWSFHLGPDSATLGFLGVGVFRIPDSSTITVEPEPGADHRMVERYLAGVVFAVLLHLRGAVVYHAAANAVSDAEAIALVGESGAGKSTLSALLHLRGCRCLTDDVLPARVETAGVFVSRGYPRVKVDQKFAVRHHLAATAMQPVHPDEDQVYLVLDERYPSSPLRLRALFFLERADVLSIRKLSAREAMMESIRFTLPARLMQINGGEEHFRRCSTIVSSVPAYALCRTDDRRDQQQLADLVMAQLDR